jgi:hypothetical protein
MIVMLGVTAASDDGEVTDCSREVIHVTKFLKIDDSDENS